MGSERDSGSPAGAPKAKSPSKKKKGKSFALTVGGGSTSRGTTANRSRDDRGGRLVSGIAAAPKPKTKVSRKGGAADGPESDPGAAKRRRDAKRRGGRRGTILTTPLGDPSIPAVSRKALLGN